MSDGREWVESQVEGYFFILMLQIKVCLPCVKQWYFSEASGDKILSCVGCHRIVECGTWEEEAFRITATGILVICRRAVSARGAWEGGFLGFYFHPPLFLFHILEFSIAFSSVTQSCPTLCDPHGLQHARLPCPSQTPGVHSDSRPLSQWCHPAISSSVIPFSSCPQSLPASEFFSMSQVFA